MLSRSAATLGFSLAMTALLALPSQGEAQARRAQRSGYVPANGVNYYYELHGRGLPVLISHGALGSIDMFRPILPLLAKERQYIAIDLHGYGRTALGDRHISLIAIGDELAGLLNKLGY